MNRNILFCINLTLILYFLKRSLMWVLHEEWGVARSEIKTGYQFSNYQYKRKYLLHI